MKHEKKVSDKVSSDWLAFDDTKHPATHIFAHGCPEGSKYDSEQSKCIIHEVGHRIDTMNCSTGKAEELVLEPEFTPFLCDTKKPNCFIGTLVPGIRLYHGSPIRFQFPYLPNRGDNRMTPNSRAALNYSFEKGRIPDYEGYVYGYLYEYEVEKPIFPILFLCGSVWDIEPSLIHHTVEEYARNARFPLAKSVAPVGDIARLFVQIECGLIKGIYVPSHQNQIKLCPAVIDHLKMQAVYFVRQRKQRREFQRII